MRIDELNADEFFEAVALAAEGIQDVMASDSGQELGKSLADIYGEEGSDAQKGMEVLRAVLAKLPALLRENGESVYKVMAALDGVSVAEYKAEFTPAKLMADVKAVVEWATGNVAEVTAFLAS